MAPNPSIEDDGAENLRRYFKNVNRNRKLPGKYPALAARAALLERTTARNRESHEALHPGGFAATVW
jgi:hypothetical protein